MPLQGSTYKNLTSDEQLYIVTNLFTHYDGNTLKHGKIKQIADIFGVHSTTISRLWKRALKVYNNSEANNTTNDNKTNSNNNDNNSNEFITMIGSKKHLSGRRATYNSEELKAAVEALPPHCRTSYRTISKHLGIPSSTLHRINMKTDCLQFTSA